MSESRSDYSLLTTGSMMVLAAVAIAGALYFTRRVMVPFVLAIFISYLVSPLVDFLRVQCRIPRPAAVTMALLVAALDARGVELIDKEPRQGLSGMIAFLHPRSTGGVLIELVDADTIRS